jgi:hypothetical protein
MKLIILLDEQRTALRNIQFNFHGNNIVPNQTKDCSQEYSIQFPWQQYCPKPDRQITPFGWIKQKQIVAARLIRSSNNNS